MGLIRNILPYLLVLFFLFKANKQPLFLLGIPFLMYMSNSIFFENAKPFQIPGSLYDQLIFIWLIIVWLLSKVFFDNKFRKQRGNIRLNVTDYSVIVLIVISIIGLVSAITNYYPFTTGLLQEFLIEISLFIGYFIIKNWISSNKTEIVVSFLYSLVIVNSIASILFILHQGLHFHVYIGEEYMSESFQGQEITRSFWFMPQFLLFSIAFLLVFAKKYSLVSIGLLSVNLLALVITYTISSLIIAILVLIIYFLLNGLKNGKLATAVKNLVIYALLGMGAVFIMSRFMPANTNFLLSRISEHTNSQYTEKEPNDMDVRFTNTADVISKIDRDKKLLGMGPVTKVQATKFDEMQANTADIAWSGVIFRWGYIGLSLFVLIYIFSSFQAFNFFMKSDGIISDLALMLLLLIISQFIESFVSWTFLSGHGVTIGLWYFAILSTLPGFNKANVSAANKDDYAPNLYKLIFG
jgi:hypothetical protein